MIALASVDKGVIQSIESTAPRSVDKTSIDFIQPAVVLPIANPSGRRRQRDRAPAPFSPNGSSDKVRIDQLTTTAKNITLVTDFSGLETPSIALAALGVPTHLLSISEMKSHMRAFIISNFKPEHVYTDVFERKTRHADLYVAGPPCVRFSHLGLRAGEPDKSSSTLERSIDYVVWARPRAFIIENVVGLVTFEGGTLLAEVLKRLCCKGAYSVSHEICNTKDFGLPHSRRRVYIVGVLRESQVHTFAFPTYAGRHQSLLDVLDPPEAGDSHRRTPPASQVVACAIVDKELHAVQADGLSAAKPDRIIDVDCCLPWSSLATTHCPCFTASRKRGLWLLSRGRRLRPHEALRLQGVSIQDWASSLTDSQMFEAAGSSMSVVVLIELLRTLLPCAGLGRHLGACSTSRSPTGKSPASPPCHLFTSAVVFNQPIATWDASAVFASRIDFVTDDLNGRYLSGRPGCCS